MTPRTVVRIANRDIPITDSSGVLKVTDQGALVLLNGANRIIFSSNASGPVENPTT